MSVYEEEILIQTLLFVMTAGLHFSAVFIFSFFSILIDEPSNPRK